MLPFLVSIFLQWPRQWSKFILSSLNNNFMGPTQVIKWISSFLSNDSWSNWWRQNWWATFLLAKPYSQCKFPPNEKDWVSPRKTWLVNITICVRTNTIFKIWRYQTITFCRSQILSGNWKSFKAINIWSCSPARILKKDH